MNWPIEGKWKQFTVAAGERWGNSPITIGKRLPAKRISWWGELRAVCSGEGRGRRAGRRSQDCTSPSAKGKGAAYLDDGPIKAAPKKMLEESPIQCKLIKTPA